MDATETTVRSLLAAANLAPSEEEIAGLVAGYEDYQAGIEALYAVPEARYASPALIFNAAPVFADWAH
jgi:citrate lyase beta subunit